MKRDTRARRIEELAEGASHCRAFGHHWEHVTHAGGRVKGWAVTMACPTCGTQKLFQLSSRGDLTAPRYIYPENYLAAFFIGPNERAAMRLDALGLAGPVLKVVNGDRPALPMGKGKGLPGRRADER
jgi:hypothetical protein